MKKEALLSTLNEVLDIVKEHVDFDWSVKLKDPRASKADRLLNYTSNLENFLRQNFNANGRGLTEYVRSIRHYLKGEDENLLLYIASERNRAVHVGVDRIDFEAFEGAYNTFVARVKKNYPDKVWDYS